MSRALPKFESPHTRGSLGVDSTSAGAVRLLHACDETFLRPRLSHLGKPVAGYLCASFPPPQKIKSRKMLYHHHTATGSKQTQRSLLVSFIKLSLHPHPTSALPLQSCSHDQSSPLPCCSHHLRSSRVLLRRLAHVPPLLQRRRQLGQAATTSQHVRHAPTPPLCRLRARSGS